MGSVLNEVSEAHFGIKFTVNPTSEILTPGHPALEIRMAAIPNHAVASFGANTELKAIHCLTCEVIRRSTAEDVSYSVESAQHLAGFVFDAQRSRGCIRRGSHSENSDLLTPSKIASAGAAVQAGTPTVFCELTWGLARLGLPRKKDGVALAVDRAVTAAGHVGRSLGVEAPG